MRGALCRGLGALAIAFTAVVCAAGCGAKDLVSVNQPIPADMRTTFKVQKISGMNYTSADEDFLSGGGIQLNVLNSIVKEFSIHTGCGSAIGKHREITADRVVMRDYVTHFDASKCTPEQLAAAERVGAVIASSPRYRFDGERLQLISDKATITLTLVSKAEMPNGGFSS
jgi:hypothetical protein